MPQSQPLAFWFRRDLRLNDNAGLYRALRSGLPVLPVFIFDQNILDKLPAQDARLSFLHQEIQRLKRELQAFGSDLLVMQGQPETLWPQIQAQYNLSGVFLNHDYESYALTRDARVKAFFIEKNLQFQSFKDHVVFEKLEVAKPDGGPYTVFTPYAKRWRQTLDSRPDAEAHSFYLKPYPSLAHCQTQLFSFHAPEMPSLQSLGFEAQDLAFPSRSVAPKVIKDYDQTRDFPAKEQGTSHLGLHFRFGTISIRDQALNALKLNATYLNELIWRDFYAMILANFPHVETKAFKPAYERIPWRENETEFQRWCQGKTGYPLVDAGMRQLNATGYMHNRLRMVCASFLTKHLLMDWRKGEAYFAEKLLDFDLASNNGGWQWASSSGTDAAPYFRIFNPESQQKKFDPKGEFIRKWVPEYGSLNYPAPIVEHNFARQRCLDTYKKHLNHDESPEL